MALDAQGADAMEGATTLALLHGAGDTSRVWDRTRRHLRHRSVAVDLPGRGRRPSDITEVTLDAAAESAANDIRAGATAPYVIVAHSAGAIVASGAAGRLGPDVRHIVLVAGLTAPHGMAVVDALFPDRRADLAMQWALLRVTYAGHTFVRGPESRVNTDHDFVVLTEPIVARNIDSLNLMLQPVSWHGVPLDTPRTWIRPLEDAIQSAEMQRRLIAACGATDVIDIDSDHSPARSRPHELAGLLDRIAALYDDPSSSLV